MSLAANEQPSEAQVIAAQLAATRQRLDVARSVLAGTGRPELAEVAAGFRLLERAHTLTPGDRRALHRLSLALVLRALVPASSEAR